EISVRLVANSPKEETPQRQVIALAPNQPRYRILIVDDKKNNRQLLVELLTPLGFAVQEARNGQEALDISQSWSPHLIWMDIRMPIMDGYEATRRIKETQEGSNVLIIALTASTFEEEGALVLQAGCDDFMRKPFRQAQIFGMMQQHLGVQYLYGQNNPPPPPKENATSAAQLPTLNHQSTFDAEWLDHLKEAALILDPDQTLTLINQIRDRAPAQATQLEAWANNFEYEQILAWVDNYISSCSND
ncbi:MAG: response regulator, partial [Ardenticatenaceae bacterium]